MKRKWTLRRQVKHLNWQVAYWEYHKLLERAKALRLFHAEDIDDEMIWDIKQLFIERDIEQAFTERDKGNIK